MQEVFLNLTRHLIWSITIVAYLMLWQTLRRFKTASSLPASPKAHDAGISKFDFNEDRELVATVSHVRF